MPAREGSSWRSALKTAGIADLKGQWRGLFGTEPPHYNRPFLESRLAYRIQELAFGGLRPETRARLEALGEQLDGGNVVPRRIRADERPIAGTRLVRQSGDPADFEKIPLGGTRRLFNPVGTMAVSLKCITPTQIAIPPAPALASAERAGEAVEVYWQALLRHVPLAEFRDGTDNREVLAACEEPSRLSDFRGPKAEGRATPGTLFRGSALYFDTANSNGRSVTPPGVLDGPVVS